MLKAKQVSILLFVWALSYLPSAAYPPALLDDADTVHAEAAREIVESGNWITLHANGIRYLEKAPLMYWLVAVSYSLLGVSEFSTRLPIALSTLALMLATFLLGRYAFGDRAGLYAGIMIGTCIGIYLFTRVLWPDVLLTFFITMSFYCFLKADDAPSPRLTHVYGIYFFGALAVLTKGLIGAAFPAIIICVYLIVNGRLRKLFSFRPLTGALVFLLVAAPWHIAAGLQNPASLMQSTPHASQGRGFFWFYFMNEHFLRYLGRRYPADYDTVPLVLFFILHLVWLFPWSIFLALAVREMPRRLKPPDSEQRRALFCAIWAVLILLFFSFSTTQEYYTMPAYPAIALLLGRALWNSELKWKEGSARRWALISQSVLTVIGLLVFTAGMIAFIATRQMVIEGDISSTLTRNPQAYALSLGHVLDLTGGSVAALRVPVIGTAIVFFIGTVTALALRVKVSHGASIASVTLMMSLFFFFAHKSFGAFDPYLSSKFLADAIMREYRQGDTIVINGEYESGSSLNFYTGKQVHILNGRSANLEYGSYFYDAPAIFHDNESIRTLWSAPGRVFLFTDGLKIPELEALLPGGFHVLVEGGGKAVLTNR